MSRRIKIRSDQSRRPVIPNRVVAAFASFLFVALPFYVESPSAHGVESSRVEAIQTIESPLGSIRVGRSVSPERAESFEPFEMTAEFQKPRGVAVAEDDLAGIYGDFYVELLEDETRDLDEENNVALRRWRLYPMRRGKLTLPPIPISFSFVKSSDSSETETVVALLPERELVVPESDSPLKSADEIKVNLEPIRRIPKLISFIAIAFAAILILFAVIFASKKNTVVNAKNVSTETPYERTLRKLDELKNSRIYLENDRQFYDEIDDILREYVSNVFPLKAQEMTTQEILGRLNSQAFFHADPENRDATPNLENFSREPSDSEKASVAIATLEEPLIHSQLKATLTELDLVKFAKRPTTFSDATEIYTKVCDVVERSFSSYVKRLDELRRQLADRASSLNDERN